MVTSFLRTRTSSENTGDVIVENASIRLVSRVLADVEFAIQSSTWRDLRTLSRDRSNSGDPVYPPSILIHR